MPPWGGDSLAVVGQNRKIIIFSLRELPEMTRGRGVKLQSYKDGGLADVTTLTLSEGLRWKTRSGVRTETDIKTYIGSARRRPGRDARISRNNRFGNYE